MSSSTVRFRAPGERSRSSAPASTRRAETKRSDADRGGAHRRVVGGRERLPGWGDLGGSATAPRVGRVEKRLASVRTSRIVGWLVLAALVFVAYEAHVYATKDALAAVQAARAENARLHLKLNRLRGEFDAATSPAVVVARAKALGLVEGIGYGAPIRVAAR